MSTLGKRAREEDMKVQRKRKSAAERLQRLEDRTLTKRVEVYLRNTEESPFLRLAPELRNRIYYFAACDAVHDHYWEKVNPPMSLVSWQVRWEFESLYYSSAIMKLERHFHYSNSMARCGVEVMADVPRSTLRALLGVQSEDLDQAVGTHLGGYGDVRTSGPCAPEFSIDCEWQCAASVGEDCYYRFEGVLVFAADCSLSWSNRLWVWQPGNEMGFDDIACDAANAIAQTNDTTTLPFNREEWDRLYNRRYDWRT